MQTLIDKYTKLSSILSDLELEIKKLQIFKKKAESAFSSYDLSLIMLLKKTDEKMKNEGFFRSGYYYINSKGQRIRYNKAIGEFEQTISKYENVWNIKDFEISFIFDQYYIYLNLNKNIKNIMSKISNVKKNIDKIKISLGTFLLEDLKSSLFNSVEEEIDFYSKETEKVNFYKEKCFIKENKELIQSLLNVNSMKIINKGNSIYIISYIDNNGKYNTLDKKLFLIKLYEAFDIENKKEILKMEEKYIVDYQVEKLLMKNK